MIESIVEFIKKAQEQCTKPTVVDVHHFNKKIVDSSRTKMFKKLGDGILTLPFINQEQKTKMQSEMLKLQKYIDDINASQVNLNIHLNKYVNEQCKKTFISALEVQHAGSLLAQSTFFNHTSQQQTFLQKYEKLLNYSYFWEHLLHLESKFNPININIEELVETINKFQGQGQKTQIEYIQKEVIKEVQVDRIVYVTKDNPELQQQLQATRQELWALKEQKTIDENNLKLLEAHQLVYGINCLQDVKKGINIYNQLNNQDSRNALAQLLQQGKIIPLDLELAQKIYKDNMDKTNNLQAMYQYGKIQFINKKRLLEGFGILKKAADLGHIEAALDIGLLYWQGIKENKQFIIKQNQELAKQYINKGKDTPRGQCEMGVIESDSYTSIEYFKQSIKLGYIPAFYFFGQHYEQDHREKEALEQYTQGALQQEIKCIEHLLHYQLQEAVHYNILDKFQGYLEYLATMKQSGEAFYYLGVCNSQNKELQIKYFQLGAKLENEKSIVKLGELNQDLVVLEKYASYGDQNALFNLGLHYEQLGQLDAAIDNYKQSQTKESFERLSQIYINEDRRDEKLSKQYQQLALHSPRMDTETELIQSLILTNSRSV